MQALSLSAQAALLCGCLVLSLGLSSADLASRELEVPAAGAPGTEELKVQAASINVAAATLQSAAAATGMSPAAVVQLLRTNKDAHVTPGGVHYACTFGNPQYPEEWKQPPAPGSLVAEVRAANLPAWEEHLTNANAENVFRLHSRPAARRKIYLAFQGCNTVGTSWNWADSSKLGDGVAIVTPPFDWDNDPTTFSPDERVAILEVWRIVSEDFALWDVDVTTEPLTDAQLERSNAQDEEYGVRMCIGGRSDAWVYPYGVGGVARTGTRVWGDLQANTAFTFAAVVFEPDGPAFFLPTNQLAHTISHELGHTVGLRHDGYTFRHDNGTIETREYAEGTAAWSPIMGSPAEDFTGGFVTWSNMVAYPPMPGYINATNFQDDLAIISNAALPLNDEDNNTETNSLQNDRVNPPFPPIQLDCPDNPAEFAQLCSQPFPESPTIVRRGYNAVIDSASDFDFFSFNARSPGNVTVWLVVVGQFNNGARWYHRTNLRPAMAFINSPVTSVVNEPVNFNTTLQRMTAVLPQDLNYPATVTFVVAADNTNGATRTNGTHDSGIPSNYGNVGDYSVFVDFPGRDPPPPPPPACDDPDRCSANGACDGCACVSTNEPCVCAAGEGFVPRRDNALGFHCAWNLGSTINRRLYSVRPNSRVRLPWRLGAGRICNERQVVASVRILNGLVACPTTPRTPPRLAPAPRGEPVLTEDCNANNGTSYTTFNVGNLSTTRAANRRCRRVTVGTSDGVSHTFFLWVTLD